jgi:sodium-dependent dicarboxylate transporter 2/3/5
VKQIGLLLGPILFLITILFFNPADLSKEGVAVLACTLWVSVWWITEAIPISATALLPLVLFPLCQALTIQKSASAFANPLIFLYMGGFMIAVAIEKWNLHRRIALNIILWVGSDLSRIILGFMIATAFLSMWISNTATAVMMMPIGVAVVKQLENGLDENTLNKHELGQALMLAIAYGCSIGGMATIIGTPTNLVFIGMIDEFYDVEISFTQWMMFALPISIILLFFTWNYLVRFAFKLHSNSEIKASHSEIRQHLEALGPISPEEKRVLIVFILVAMAWIGRAYVLQPFIPGINDTVIALIGAIILFLIPARKGKMLLDWHTAESIPWGIIILFGGGLTLAAGFENTGLASWIGNQLNLFELVPYFILVFVLVVMVNFLTEITSNVATASMLLPILAALALSIDVHPFGLMVAATLAASCAFMLPVATPPNAVVFGSQYLTIPGMIRVGIWMNILSVIILSMIVYYVLPVIWDIDLTSFPVELK